jgi:dipeptidyl aminopeptidase/acylaminoacyl peptidase
VSAKPIWLGKDVVGGVPSQVRPDRKPPPHWRLEAVFATSRPHHLAASPDGSNVAFVLDLEGTTDIWSLHLSDRALTRLTADRGLVAYWEDSAPIWSPDGTTLAYNSDGHVRLVAATGGPPRRLTAASAGAWLDDQRLVVIVERDRCSRLSVVSVDDPWPVPFGPSDGDVGRPRLAPDGRIVATFWPKDDKSRSDIIVTHPGGEWTTLVGHPDRRAADHALHGDRVAYTLEDGDRAGIFLTDLDGSAHSKLAGGDGDFSSLVWDRGGDSLFAILTSHGRSDLVRIRLDGTVETLAEGGTWDSPVATSLGTVATHEASDSPPAIVAIDADGARTTIFDGAPATIRSAPYAELERVTFPSSGGLEIEGFLFRPAATSAPVPAVVYPHGGPTSLYGDEWDGHAQYFVDKGYAWLAINFRGSTSYGIDFERANHGDWGLGDVDDCIAAADYLAGLGWVDPGRLAIYGASYGSYLALATLVRKDNPYACAVAKYGDCDILTSWAQGDREGIEDLERMMGHPSENRQAYRAASPIHEIGRISRPIMVAHGERDARVHPRQSEQLVEALDQVGATYEYFTYPTEGHGLLRREPQLHFYRRLERFLDWYLI